MKEFHKIDSFCFTEIKSRPGAKFSTYTHDYPEIGLKMRLADSPEK